jgi:hypothetical protein
MALDKILEKIAISKELKDKAFVERNARLSRARDIAKDRSQFIYSLGEIPDRDALFESGKYYMNVKGPEHGRYPNNIKSFENILKRYDQLTKNPMGDKTRLHNPSDSLSSHVSKVKKMKVLKNFGKRFLATGAVAYGGKKLYNKLTEKTAFSNPGIFRNLAKQNAVKALENLGLGVLAVPSAQTMFDPNASEHDKSHAKYELGGLGILAAHPTYEMAHSLKENAPQIRGAVQEGLTNKVAPHLTNMGTNLMEHTSPMARSVGQGISNLAGKIRFR